MNRRPYAVITPEPARPSVQTLGGRATQMSQGRQVYVFGLVALDSSPAQFRLDVPRIPAWSAQPDGEICERLWRVRTAGQALQRFGEELLPLQPNDFNNAASVGASEGGSGYYKIRVRADTSSGYSIFLMDVGQTIDLYAYKVDVDIVAPENAFEATEGNRTLDTSRRTGLVVDARIGGSVLAIEESVSNLECKFTQHLVIEANDRAVIPVPRSAVAVQIVMNALGTNPGDWSRDIGDARLFPPFVTGMMVFRDRALLRDHRSIGDETHLRSDSQGVDRFATLTWTIRP